MWCSGKQLTDLRPLASADRHLILTQHQAVMIVARHPVKIDRKTAMRPDKSAVVDLFQ